LYTEAKRKEKENPISKSASASPPIDQNLLAADRSTSSPDGLAIS